MKRFWLGAAITLLIGGLGTIACALMISGFDLKKFSGDPYTTKNYEETGTFTRISIETSTADIELRRSEDGTCKAVCRENDEYTFEVEVNGNVLEIKSHEKRKWFRFFMLNFEEPKVTLYLPDAEYEKLAVRSSTGDIRIPADVRFREVELIGSTGDFNGSLGNCESVKIETSTGDINLTGTYARYVTVKTATGDVKLDSVIADETISITTSTGDVKLDGIDGPAIKIKTATGDVNGTVLSPKAFQTKTSTGSVVVPSDSASQTCEITTSTGDINMSVK